MSDLGRVPVYEWEETNEYELLAWIKASERRVDILTTLSDSPKNTTDFAERWSVESETIRYHLKQLKDGGPSETHPQLVKILTPNREQYRLWGLTESGEELIKYLE
jgi:predicted ArsR family transcriptional regulator